MTKYEHENWEHTVDSMGRPLGRLHGMEVGKHKYTILPMTPLKDRIYEGTLLPTFWATFKWNEQATCWEQITEWFCRYGVAVNHMVNRAKKHEAEGK